MFHGKEVILQSVRIFLVGMIMIASVLLLVLLVPAATTATSGINATDASATTPGTGMSTSPNAVSRAMFSAANATERAVDSVSQAIAKVSTPISLPKPHIGTFISTAFASTVHGISNGTGSAARSIGGGFMFALRMPGNITGMILGRTGMAVSAIIRPPDHAAVPIIDPNSPKLRAAQVALPATTTTTATRTNTPAPQWPIHGAITTQFGVPEPPYQPIHTGLDISDGRRRGVTPIKPFRPGRVIVAEHSRIKLGNHVVIDHGSGVTSVYGHLNSISVQVGQLVDESTIVGYEGTTGVSTGTHLHFEIRVDGQATDPHKFIPGQP